MDTAALTNVVASLILVGLLTFASYRTLVAYRRVRRLLRGVSDAVTSPMWWSVQPQRRQLRRSIAAAQASVAAASARGVPIGDLPSVTRRLAAAGADVDAALCAAARAGRVPTELRRQALEVGRAAGDVSDAVSRALAADTAPAIAGVLDAVRVELRAVSSGWSGAVTRGR